MMNQPNPRDVRQAACVSRGKTARLYAKLLMPVVLVVFSQSLWSDPVLGPKLEEGIKELKPVLATYAVNTPLEGVFGPVPEQPSEEEIAAASRTGNPLDVSFNLPGADIPINRP